MFRICEFIWHCSRHRRYRTLTRTTTRFLKKKIRIYYPRIGRIIEILFIIMGTYYTLDKYIRDDKLRFFMLLYDNFMCVLRSQRLKRPATATAAKYPPTFGPPGN